MSLPERNKTNLSISTALWILKEAIVWPAFGQGRERGLGSASMKADRPAHCGSLGTTYGWFMNSGCDVMSALCIFELRSSFVVGSQFTLKRDGIATQWPSLKQEVVRTINGEQPCFSKTTSAYGLSKTIFLNLNSTRVETKQEITSLVTIITRKEEVGSWN